MRSHWLGCEIHACRFLAFVLTSWSALTCRVSWRLAHDEDLVASGTYRFVICGQQRVQEGELRLKIGPGRHERERRAHQTSGRGTHDGPVGNDRVARSEEGAQHWRQKCSDELKVEEPCVTEENCKLFSASDDQNGFQRT